MFEIAVAVVGVVVALYLVFLVIIGVQLKNYHRMVRQAVIAEFGIAALPFLSDRRIIEQISDCHRKGYPAATAALTLTLLLQDILADPSDGDER